MSNVLASFNPEYFANESLRLLLPRLGMAATVHRGYDKSVQQRGDLITISKPGTFVAEDQPSSDQDIKAEDIQIQLNHHEGVKFSITDREATFTGQGIIDSHIEPAVNALARAIDSTLLDLYATVPWFIDVAATSGPDDLVNANSSLFGRNVDVESSGNMFFLFDQDMREDMLKDEAFSQWHGAGDTGVSTQVRGILGMKYGFNNYALPGVKSHIPGTLVSDGPPELVGAHSIGATTITFDDAVSLVGTLVVGDSLVIGGNVQRYSVAGLATAAGDVITVTLASPLVDDYLNNSIITVELDTYSACMAYHRNAFALAMAPLSTIGTAVSDARVATAIDEQTGLSLRSMLYYMPDSGLIKVKLDALWGVKTLDPNMALLARN